MTVKAGVKRYGPALLVLVLLLSWAGFCALPWLIQSYFLPRIRQETGLAIEAEIRRIGLFGADLAAVRIGRGKQAIAADSVQVDYSPLGIWQREIEGVRVSGLCLPVQVEDGGASLPALAPLSASEPRSSENSSRLLSLKQVHIHQGRLRLNYRETRTRLPFDLRIRPGRPDWRRLRARLSLFPCEHPLQAEIQMDREKNRLSADISGADIAAARFSPWLGPGILPRGRVRLTAQARFQIEPFAVSALQGELSFADQGSRYQTLQTRENSRFSLVFQSPDGKAWRIESSGPSFSHPLALRPRIEARGQFVGQTEKQLSADFDLFLDTAPPDAKTPPDKTLCLNGSLTAALCPEGGWRFDMDAHSTDQNLCLPHIKLAWRSLGLNGSATAGPQQTRAEAGLTAHGLEIHGPRWRTTLPRLRLKARADRPSPAGLVVRGKGEIAGASLNGSGLRVRGIRLKFPFQWPLAGKGKKGEIGARHIQYQHHELGSLSGLVQQAGAGVGVNLWYASQVVPELGISLIGQYGFDGRGRFQIKGKRPAAADAIDLGRFADPAKGLIFDGELDLCGELRMEKAEISGQYRIHLANGRLSQKQQGLFLEGLKLDLAFPDIREFRSAPAQPLRFESAGIGRIRLKSANFDLQVESGPRLLVEKGGFGWCDGRVSAEALRIPPDESGYQLTLYCDRLNLPMLLDQIGVGQAEGKGTVSGRIPLLIQDQEIRFHDGFLFSAPGEGGTLHVQAADLLTAGIPQNTPQYFQLDLARAALKDFDYNWAKLRLNSQGSELSLNLQFDGKPTHPLPFVYKKEFGGFVRVQAEHPGSNFQGIRLDLNMVLPLNRLLKYKDVLGNVQ